MDSATSPIVDDRFVLLEALGRGGMGRVYRAVDARGGREVALKVATDAGDAGPGHPFASEFEVWAALRHPNIVRVHELARARRGPLPHGTPYLVLEYFPGDPAHRVLEPGRASPAEIVGVARSVLRALTHVHAAGLVHRDLKPGNVLVHRDRHRHSRVKITDFGLACRAGGAGRRGQVSGSIPYLSPEAIRGEPVDGRADLYGLGLLLYYLCTGDSPSATGDPGAILAWHLEGSLPDPCERRPELPERLGRFVRRLAARSVSERPGSAAEALSWLGDPSRRVRERSRPDGLAERAAVRLALDAARLGAVRVLPIPGERGAAGVVLHEARVRAQLHGLDFRTVGLGRSRTLREDVATLVVDLLASRGEGARSSARRYGLCAALPVAFAGAVPVKDRTRSGTEAAPTEETGSRVAAFVLESARLAPIVLAVGPSSTADPVSRGLVRGLIAAATREPFPERRGAGGLVLLADPSWNPFPGPGRSAARPVADQEQPLVAPQFTQT